MNSVVMERSLYFPFSASRELALVSVNVTICALSTFSISTSVSENHLLHSTYNLESNAIHVPLMKHLAISQNAWWLSQDLQLLVMNSLSCVFICARKSALLSKEPLKLHLCALG